MADARQTAAEMAAISPRAKLAHEKLQAIVDGYLAGAPNQVVRETRKLELLSEIDALDEFPAESVWTGLVRPKLLEAPRTLWTATRWRR